MSFLIVILVIAAYWTPTIVAWSRHVPNAGSVTVINTFTGFLVVPWIVALAMACRSKPAAPQYVVPPGFQPMPPVGFTPPQPMPQPYQPLPLQARQDDH